MTSVGARQRNNRRERGASLVEFALICPLLFAIFLGTITGGLALSKKNSMTNAVREGGRLGATLFNEDSAWTWDDWADDVRLRVEELAGNDLDADEICVEMVDTKGTPALGDDAVIGEYPAGGCTGTLAVGRPDTPLSADDCLVKVWARTSADFETIFFSRTLDLEANAVGLYERADKCPIP